MNCMKCGKETAENHVFCDTCLKDMEKYPVKPGTPVHIPSRKSAEQDRRPPRKKEPTKDDLIAQHHRMIKWLLIALGVLAVAFVIVTGFLLYTLGDVPSAFGLFGKT